MSGIRKSSRGLSINHTGFWIASSDSGWLGDQLDGGNDIPSRTSVSNHNGNPELSLNCLGHAVILQSSFCLVRFMCCGEARRRETIDTRRRSSGREEDGQSPPESTPTLSSHHSLLAHATEALVRN